MTRTDERGTGSISPSMKLGLSLGETMGWFAFCPIGEVSFHSPPFTTLPLSISRLLMQDRFQV